MEVIECIHREHIRSIGHGVEIGTCSKCGQQVQRNVDKLRDHPTVTKLGRIDGRLVLPNHNFKLLLGPQDKADLADATAAVAKLRVAPPGKEEAQAGPKWYRDNKRQMIKDLLAMGKDAFLERWKVKPQLISHLKADKLYKKLAQAPGAKAPKPKPPSGDKLPQLPPWSNDWSPEVQVRWLAVYEKLISK